MVPYDAYSTNQIEQILLVASCVEVRYHHTLTLVKMEFYETLQDPMDKGSPSSKGDCLYRFYPIILDWNIYKIMILKDKKKTFNQKKPSPFTELVQTRWDQKCLLEPLDQMN